MPLKYKYFECIGPGKGKISGYVSSLTPHKKWRPCSCWTPSLQRSLMHRRSSAWRTRVTLRLTLEPLQAAPASQRSGTSQQPRTPASALARTHTSLPAQRQLNLSGSLLPQRPLTLPSMAIAERHNKANLQLGMLFCGGCGIPFNVSRSPLFKRALQSVAEAGPGFKPVSYNALRGSMLDKVRYGHSFTAEPCFWRSQATGEVRKERLRSL